MVFSGVVNWPNRELKQRRFWTAHVNRKWGRSCRWSMYLWVALSLKKKKRRKHFRLKVLHDLLLQQTGLQGFKSNTSIIFGNSPLLACAWFSYFLPPTKALLAWFHFWLVLQHTIVPKSVLQPNLSYIIIFLFAYCHWDLGLIRSDPGLFPQDSTYPHKKLGLYDNENVRVLVFNIDWVFV